MLRRGPQEEEDTEATYVHNLGMAHAVGMVVLSSTGLMVMIFFSDDLLMVLMVLYCLAAAYTSVCLLSYCCGKAIPALMREVCHSYVLTHESTRTALVC